ncbi:MAG: hypothetical protein V7784_07320 [Oceanospirillaceae bacterium]
MSKDKPKPRRTKNVMDSLIHYSAEFKIRFSERLAYVSLSFKNNKNHTLDGSE